MAAPDLAALNASRADRVRLHAALGDSTRLAIVDRLLLGDLGSAELTADLGVPTNLLAHHLTVLREAGVIRQLRSEGDRRRSYFRLSESEQVLALMPAAAGPRSATRVTFVCTHNSARSQLAAATWNAVAAVPATSAGTHPAARIHPRAISTGRRHGLAIHDQRTARTADVVRPGDLIVAVCDRAHEELPTGSTRLHWSIPDPVRLDTDAAFESALADIDRRVRILAAALDAPTGRPHGGSP